MIDCLVFYAISAAFQKLLRRIHDGSPGRDDILNKNADRQQHRLRPRNISCQDCKYTSFDIYVCLGQNIQRHSGIGRN